MPNTLLTMTLASNFGTFLLYGLSCIICLVAITTIPSSSWCATWWSRCLDWSQTWPAWRST